MFKQIDENFDPKSINNFIFKSIFISIELDIHWTVLFNIKKEINLFTNHLIKT